MNAHNTHLPTDRKTRARANNAEITLELKRQKVKSSTQKNTLTIPASYAL